MKVFSRLNNNKKKRKNKYKIDIKQVGDLLTFSGFFTDQNYAVKELWLISRNKEEKYKIGETALNNKFDFKISLNDLMSKLVKSSQANLFDWFIKITRPYNAIKDEKKITNGEYNLIESSEGLKYVEYLIRLGRFENTEVNGLDYFKLNNHYLINYITSKGNLSLKLDEEVTPSIKLQIDKVKNRNGILKMEGKIFTNNSNIIDGKWVLKGRNSNKDFDLQSVHFDSQKEITTKKYGLNRYKYHGELNFNTINNGLLLDDDVYDLYLLVRLHNHPEEILVRVGNPTVRTKLFLKSLKANNHNEGMIINPYLTFKKANLSFEVYKFSMDTFKYLKKVMNWSWLIKLINKNKNVWLVGERVYKAQDTGYAFFKYMRENHPNQEVYYVIDKQSRESKNVEALGNILDFKSKEHILKSLIAKKVISSHHPDYLYPIRTVKFKNKVRADKVFLQHGVMGTKNMVANYGKNATSGFDTDFFIVSSDFEKEMIINDFGYSKKDVFVTGLSRFDTLFEQNVVRKRQILIIPTWRDWIIQDEDFFESEYYVRYNSLINSSDLHNLAKKYQFDIIFCLHPNMQKYSQYFSNDSVRVINQGEVDVQFLIKESALMITDYSSVGFDFSFLSKPVIYYQFDRSRFIGKRPSHLDLDNDLPGEICFEESEILDLLCEYSENDFQMKSEYVRRANKFIKYKDRLSSERIYKVIRDNKANRKVINPKVKLLLHESFKRFRKSKYYFPSMKLFYNVGKRIIPVDKKLILFESGVGKQYADSPRNIYEEIVNQKLPYKKVWVYNSPYRFKDNQTKRITRLSPLYYYYLIRAGYWVNNQNFPTYIKKRKQTTYLQTWHGTPLKKMLYDIKEVHGRSDDYVDRVGMAVKNWDYLISPSPYATNAFKSAFHYDGNILELGYPRNDIFYRKEKVEIAANVRKKLKIDPGKKVILYAPTFRDNQVSSKNKFVFELQMDLERMKEQLGEDYVLLLRMHVVISNKLVLDESVSDFVINVSNYPDIQELMLISDILITDYSSVLFDFVNTGNPILFFTYDLEDYRDNLRGFYFDFEKEAPGPFVYNTFEIIDNINNIEKVKEQYLSKYKKFQSKFSPLEDGFASKRVVEEIFVNKNND